jgi:DNA helicase-2/ATP-dependent DNA helicase PcrA
VNSRDAARRRGPLTIEGELVQKFGNGNVVNIDGNKLTIAFDKAGEKRVVDSFVERV